MRHHLFFGLIGLIVTLPPAVALASEGGLEPPTLKTTIIVENEVGGSCFQITARFAHGPPTQVLARACHGWTTATCGGLMLFGGVGVTEDQAVVLVPDHSAKVDLVEAIDQAIRSKWSRHTHLHLVFQSAICDGATITVPFEGSHLENRVEGPAAGMKGDVKIGASGSAEVTIIPQE